MCNIRDDVSECEDSESELDNLYNPELDSDSSFSDEYELELSESIISDSDSLDPLSKRRGTPFQTTEAPQEVDSDAETNSCHNQEENDRNSEVASGTSQREHPSLDIGGTARKSVLIAPDGTEWLQITSGDSLVGRCSQQNILRETSGPTPYTKRNVFLVALQVHGVFLLMTLFSNTLQNVQLLKPTANCKMRHLL